MDGPLAHDAWGTAVNNVLSGFGDAEKTAIQKTLTTVLSGLAECQNVDIEKQAGFNTKWCFVNVNRIKIIQNKI